MDTWTHGRNLFEIPNYNVYVPTKVNLIPRPKFETDSSKEKGYRYNLNRMSPYMYLNPLKCILNNFNF